MTEFFDFVDLRERFVSATDFSAFWEYFLDTYADKSAFMKMGGPAETAQVEVLVAFIAGKIHGRIVEPESMRLAKIPQAGIVHGACMIDGCITCILYFESIEKGLIVSSKTDGKTAFARFAWKFDRTNAMSPVDTSGGSSGLPN